MFLAWSSDNHHFHNWQYHKWLSAGIDLEFGEMKIMLSVICTLKLHAVSTAMTQQHSIDSNELYVCWISSCWLTYLLALLFCWVRSAILDKYSFLFLSSLIWCRSSVIWCSNNLVFDLALPLVTIIKTLGRIEYRCTWLDMNHVAYYVCVQALLHIKPS